MKTKTISFIAILFLLVGNYSCTSKDSDTNESPPPSKEYSDTTLITTWEWTKTYMPGPLSSTNPLTPTNTGTTESIIFTVDSAWSKIKNQVKIDSGEKFIVGHGFYAPADIEYDSILYIKNGVTVGTDYFILQGSILSFSHDYAGSVGGSSKWFERSE